MQTLVASSIVTPAGGFIRRAGFDFTCNPYLGCAFGCRYCYAAYLPQNKRPVADWGRWAVAKTNAGELARKAAPKLAGKAVYLSSVTDPYQPAERSRFLTRAVLEALIPHQPRLVVQTRGPLVVRDIDLLTQFDKVRVNVTIPTDSEGVRQRFEPHAPLLEARWLAVGELQASGVPVGVTVTPTLPLVDPAQFAARLAASRPAVLVTQDFHDAGGKFGADTSPEALAARDELRWGPADYAAFVARLAAACDFPVHEGEAGFFPPN